MDRFARYARSTISRDAGFVALAAATLMAGFSFDPPPALQIGAQIALMFCLFLLCRVCVLTRERLVRSEIWRGLEPGERPCGDHALARAHERLQQLLLRFAKGAAGVACVLLAGSLAASLNQTVIRSDCIGSRCGFFNRLLKK